MNTHRSVQHTRPITSIGVLHTKTILDAGAPKGEGVHADEATAELVAVPIPTVSPDNFKKAKILGIDAKIAALAAKTAALVHPHTNGMPKLDSESLGYEAHPVQHNAYEA